jgi:threonine dehydratase
MLCVLCCLQVIAGAGTIGHEILRQTDMEHIDYIFVSIGA